MDIIIVFIMIAILFAIFKNSLNLLDVIVSVDIFLRVANWALDNVTRTEAITELDRFLPDSLLEIFRNYATGSLLDVLTIFYYLILVMFAILVVKRIFFGVKD